MLSAKSGRLWKALLKLQSSVSSFFSVLHTATDDDDDDDNDSPIAISKEKYIFPAEWDRHAATILGFPSRCSLPPDHYDAVCRELAELAAAIAEFEPVRMYVRREDMKLAESLIQASTKDAAAVAAKQTKTKAKTKKTCRIDLIPSPVNHPWVRDTGPVYVRAATGASSSASPRRRFAVNLRFNEWGDKKPDAENGGVCWGQQWPVMDDRTLQENTDWARWVIDHDRSPAPVSRIDAPIRAEGGGLVSDGDGTLLITESSIVCDKRNPGMSKADIEGELMRLLGIDKVIWFPGRRNVDITDVHMDAEARFVRPGVIVYSKPHATSPGLWRELSTEIRQILDGQTDAKGRRLEIHTLEEPDPRGLVASAEDELSASYVNFYFVNGGLVVPRFGDDDRDQRALRILQELLPGRAIRQVYTNALPLTGGVLHCVTQQVPAME